LSVDPRVTEFRDAVVECLRARGIGIDDLDVEDPHVNRLTVAWCTERANQLATMVQGLLPPETFDPTDNTFE
jgi:hypothetical protein